MWISDVLSSFTTGSLNGVFIFSSVPIALIRTPLFPLPHVRTGSIPVCITEFANFISVLLFIFSSTLLPSFSDCCFKYPGYVSISIITGYSPCAIIFSP